MNRTAAPPTTHNPVHFVSGADVMNPQTRVGMGRGCFSGYCCPLYRIPEGVRRAPRGPGCFPGKCVSAFHIPTKRKIKTNQF